MIGWLMSEMWSICFAILGVYSNAIDITWGALSQLRILALCPSLRRTFKARYERRARHRFITVLREQNPV